MELISVIVPVYNVEKYLPRCIDSILKQTYKNIEILLIDDGSTDMSPLICDRYASKFKNISVYHKKNGGISSARNYGLDRISKKSNYIAFVDSDDFINPKMYEILYDNLTEYNCDIPVCNFSKVYDENCVENISNNITTVTMKEYMNSYFDDFFRTNVVWNKLYKVGRVKDIRFKEGKIYEDIFYSPQVICKANKIVINESNLYYYYQRQGSILNGGNNPNGWSDFFDASESLVKWGIKIKNKIFTMKAVDYYLGALLNRSVELYGDNENEYSFYKRKYNDALKKYILRLNNWKYSFIYIIFYFNIGIYLKIMNLKNC